MHFVDFLLNFGVEFASVLLLWSLRYKPEGSGINSRRCHCNFSLTLWPWSWLSL